MDFRVANPVDVPALNALVNGAYRGEGAKKGWTTEADLLDGIRTSEAALAEMMAAPGAVILAAEEDNRLQGCVYLEKQGGALYLGMLTVRPELQGRGIGAALMGEAEKRAKDLGCKWIKITVITARQELIAYYKRKGFSDTGERQAFPDDPKFGIKKRPLEFMVMEKAIAGN